MVVVEKNDKQEFDSSLKLISKLRYFGHTRISLQVKIVTSRDKKVARVEISLIVWKTRGNVCGYPVLGRYAKFGHATRTVLSSRQGTSVGGGQNLPLQGAS